jgi:copper transporter 1
MSNDRLAMYYNGYIILCIFIGVYLGVFMFQWKPLGNEGFVITTGDETTVCCV